MDMMMYVCMVFAGYGNLVYKCHSKYSQVYPFSSSRLQHEVK